VPLEPKQKQRNLLHYIPRLRTTFSKAGFKAKCGFCHWLRFVTKRPQIALGTRFSNVV